MSDRTRTLLAAGKLEPRATAAASREALTSALNEAVALHKREADRLDEAYRLDELRHLQFGRHTRRYREAEARALQAAKRVLAIRSQLLAL